MQRFEAKFAPKFRTCEPNSLKKLPSIDLPLVLASIAYFVLALVAFVPSRDGCV